MINLYTAATPNGHKVSILLEELDVPYEAIKVNLSLQEQKKESFLEMNPNGRIPVIVDDGHKVFESGAILLYLARKYKRFLPKEGRALSKVEQWLMFQIGGLGPMQGQNHVFRHYAPGENAYATERYFRENLRLYGVLERQLKEHEYLAGEYSIADIANWSWVNAHDWAGIDLEHFPSVKRWYEVIRQRPAVQRGLLIPPETESLSMEKKQDMGRAII